MKGNHIFIGTPRKGPKRGVVFQAKHEKPPFFLTLTSRSSPDYGSVNLALPQPKRPVQNCSLSPDFRRDNETPNLYLLPALPCTFIAFLRPFVQKDLFFRA